jgi:hypothetical protein
VSAIAEIDYSPAPDMNMGPLVYAISRTLQLEGKLQLFPASSKDSTKMLPMRSLALPCSLLCLVIFLRETSCKCLIDWLLR